MGTPDSAPRNPESFLATVDIRVNTYHTRDFCNRSSM